MQFNALMDSINKLRIRQRVASIYDMAHGAQGEGKAIAEYVKKLTKSVGIESETKGSAADFNRDIGSI